jgi:hypothetical protein
MFFSKMLYAFLVPCGSKKTHCGLKFCLPPACWFLHRLFFDPGDRNNTCLRNVGGLLLSRHYISEDNFFYRRSILSASKSAVANASDFLPPFQHFLLFISVISNDSVISFWYLHFSFELRFFCWCWPQNTHFRNFCSPVCFVIAQTSEYWHYWQFWLSLRVYSQRNRLIVDTVF